MTRLEEIRGKVAVGIIYPHDVEWLITQLDSVLVSYNEYRTRPYEHIDSYGMITRIEIERLVL
jgi:hypothetical protein